jgi:hypothetical protein
MGRVSAGTIKNLDQYAGADMELCNEVQINDRLGLLTQVLPNRTSMGMAAFHRDTSRKGDVFGPLPHGLFSYRPLHLNDARGTIACASEPRRRLYMSLSKVVQWTLLFGALAFLSACGTTTTTTTTTVFQATFTSGYGRFAAVGKPSCGHGVPAHWAGDDHRRTSAPTIASRAELDSH